MSEHFPEEAIEQAKMFIDQGDVESLRQLIEKHPTLCAARNDDEIPPTIDNSVLLYATSWPGGRPNGAAIAKLLVDSGADPMLRFNGDGETVLHWSASIEKDIEIVAALITSGADVDVDGGIICGGTPLMNALYFGFVKTAALLLSMGASIHNIISAAGLGRIDIIEAWHRGNGQYLRDSTRPSPQSRDEGDELLSEREAQTWTHRAVICALVCERYDVVDWFIEHGFDINLIPDEVGWSCLHHAAYSGSLPMAMYLVANGADLHIMEENNATPADYGVGHVHPEVMNYLVDAGTKLSLEKAAHYGRLDEVISGYEQCRDKARLLMLTIGNDGPVGKPIHVSIKKGRVAVARYLIQKNPDLHRQPVDGRSAISFAEESNDEYWLSGIAD